MTEIKKSKRLKVLWLTNIATPYRIPIWKWLGSEVDLTMALLAYTEPNRQWEFTTDEIGLNVKFLNVQAITRGERTLYLPSKSLRKLLRGNFDVIILGGWESPAYFWALLKTKFGSAAAVSHYGSTKLSHSRNQGIVAKVRGWFYRNVGAHATYGTAASDALREMGISEERIFTGFNSVDHFLFSSRVSEIRANQTSSVQQEPLGNKYLYVGQLLPRKNIDSLIDAFSKICKPHDQLRIVGSGPLANELQEQVDQLGLTSQITLTGPKNEDSLFVEYAQAHTLVLPSKNEVWGLVVNEALASGLHVVVSDQCGVAQDVADMQGVFVCGVSETELAHTMQLSSNEWNGPISEPQIVKIIPGEYGKAFLDALKFSYAEKNNLSRRQ